MNANTHLVHAIADALIEAHGEDAIDWLEGEGRAAVERGVAGWRAAIAEGAWIDRPADLLVLRALRHVEHRLGYGVGAFGDRFTATPELSAALSDAGREYRLGWRLGFARSGPVPFELGIEATRREPANGDAAPDTGIMLNLGARF